MSLQFVLGPSGHGKSTYVQDKMIADALSHRESDYLMIVPDQFTMQTQVIMSGKSPNGGILNIDVLSFGRLSHRIFKEVGKPERVLLDDLGKCLILRRVIQQQEESLSVLKKGIHSPGYVEEVKSVISEFMQYGIRPDDLEVKINTLDINPALSGKLKDILLLYRAFEKALEEEFTTKEETLYCLSERIPLSALIKRSTLVFDGFTGFTPLQLNVISALLENSKEVIITLPFSEDENGDDSVYDLFYLTKKTIRDLSRIAKDLNIEVKEPVYLSEYNRFENAPSIAYLERNLFRAKEAAYPFEPEEIHITKATDETHECRILCRKMFDLIKEKNYRYRDMAVVCGDMGTYREALKTQFEKYEIPYFMDATTDLTGNPFVAYLKSVLQVIIGNYAYLDVSALLKSAFSGFEPEYADELDNYILARNIHGKKAWMNDFKTLDTRTKRRIANLPEENKEEAKERILKRLNAGRKRFAAILEPLEELSDKKGHTAGEYLTALYTIAKKGRADHILFDMARSFETENEEGKALEYDQVYKLVMDLFDQIISLIGDEEITLKELAEVLDTGYGEIRIGIIPKSVDVLPVCDLIRSRFGEIKALFFLGVNDGNIPAAGAGGGLLSDLERSRLLELGMELAPNRTMESFAQKLYLYQVLTKPSEELYLSYLSITEDGKSKLPSYLIGELRELFPKLKVNDETLNLMLLSEEGYEKTLEDHNVLSTEDLYAEFATALGKLAGGILPEGEEEYLCRLYASLLADETSAGKAEELLEAAFDTYRGDPLSESAAKQIFKDTMAVSVSSLEKFAACAYAHFVIYGLHLDERETAEPGAVDYGNVMHAFLEKFGKYLQENKIDYATMPKEEAEKIAGEIAAELFRDETDLLTAKVTENPYLGRQVKRILSRSITAFQEQLKRGDFVPAHYEWEFKRSLNERGDLIRGKIDRVDLCEGDDATFVKILDYKSSDRKYEDLLFQCGVRIQTAVYLSEAIKKIEEEKEKEGGEKKDVKPAALLYYHLQDPFLDEEKVGDDTEKDRAKALSPFGLVVKGEATDHLDKYKETGKSPAIPVSFTSTGKTYESGTQKTMEEMEAILAEADEKVLSTVEDISAGKIEVSPLVIKKKQYDACAFCPFASACGFDEKIGGYKKRTELDVIGKPQNTGNGGAGNNGDNSDDDDDYDEINDD